MGLCGNNGKLDMTTVDDAQALLTLTNYIESRFPAGAEYDPERSQWSIGKGATTPFGDPYIEISGKAWYPTRDAVIQAATKAFDEYAEGKTGKVYWRVRPEIEQGKRGWRFYMRLVISDKEAK